MHLPFYGLDTLTDLFLEAVAADINEYIFCVVIQRKVRLRKGMRERRMGWISSYEGTKGLFNCKIMSMEGWFVCNLVVVVSFINKLGVWIDIEVWNFAVWDI